VPTVLRIGAFRLYFYSHEPNEPPHVHVDRGAATIKIWLEPVEVAKSQGFKAHEIGGIVAMVQDNRTELWEA
jgi:hypothetical protein